MSRPSRKNTAIDTARYKSMVSGEGSDIAHYRKECRELNEAIGRIHMICSDAGIPCGNIVVRVQQLAGLRVVAKEMTHDPF